VTSPTSPEIQQPRAPAIIVLAGPNGAGKTTAAPWLLRDALDLREFVNADEMARGLSAFHPEALRCRPGA
jgi:predicted ABC-type ATPase